MADWILKWPEGSCEVFAGGGEIGRTLIQLGPALVGDPFHEPPWVGKPVVHETRLTENMHGEYACVGVGVAKQSDQLPERWRASNDTPIAFEDGPVTEDDWLPHGYGAHNDWYLVSQSTGELVIAIDYPESSAISRLTRTISAHADGIEVSVCMEARRQCQRPVGLHPNFALRGPPGSFQIRPGQFQFGLTHPHGEDVSDIMPDVEFSSLAAVPLQDGGTVALDRLPLPHRTEQSVQLCGLEGKMEFVDSHAGIVWTLEWDPSVLPSSWLWFSNRGRMFAPWNGENLCLCAILTASAFDFGPAVSIADNPISSRGVATTVQVSPDRPVTIGYRLRGASL